MPQRNLFALVLVGAVSLLCWQSTRGARANREDILENYGLFVDALEQVEQNYVRPVERKDLIQSALRGLLQDLDPHSNFFNENDWRQFKRQIEGSFSGIGVQIDVDTRSSRLKVIAPMIGSPAYIAGILAGDVVLEVDGQSTEGVTRDKAVEMLQGRPGTSVKLKVLHPGGEKTEELTIVRKVIDVPSVLGDTRNKDDSWNYFLDPESKIAYIRITNFIQTTAEDLRKALDQAKAQGFKALVLDLRDDPGGLLESAVEVSDLFLKSGRIVSTKGRNTREKTWDAREDGTFTDFPMTVLINQHSASASEIVAAALQDHGRAKVVGQRSFGKGSVQNILPLEDGNSVLKLTVATYWRPSGKNIHRFPKAKPSDEWGVAPDKDLEVRLSASEYEEWVTARRERDLASVVSQKRPEGQPAPEPAKKIEDQQLEKALDTLRDELKKSVALK